MTWAARARVFIAKLLAELPPDAPLSDRRRALRGRCPWSQSQPRQAWLKEVRRILKVEPQGAARRRAEREAAAGRRLAYPRAQEQGESVVTAFGWDRAASEVALLTALCYLAFQGAAAADLAAAAAALPPQLEPAQLVQRLLGRAPAPAREEARHAAA